MATMDFGPVATALLTEHLQYTPLNLIDEIIDMANAYMYQSVAQLENAMVGMPPGRLGFRPASSTDEQGEPEYPAAKQEIEEGLHKLETLLEAAVDKNFDKFEIYVLRSVLSVPTDLVNWVRLNHYENLPVPSGEVPTPEMIQTLRRKVAASQTVSKALDKEYERNETMLAELRSLLSVHPPEQSHPPNQPNFGAFTGNGHTGNNRQPLTTHTNFTLSQLPALRAIVAELRPKLAKAHATSLGVESAKDERREERRDYIEQRTKAHLEKNTHLPSDDAAALSGKSMDLDEVEALEKVAGVFAPLPPR